jgi:hypothetical protein
MTLNNEQEGTKVQEKKKQFFFIFLACLVGAFSYVPTYWKGAKRTYTGWSFILDKPSQHIINTQLLAIQVAVVVIVAATYYYLFLRGK